MENLSSSFGDLSLSVPSYAIVSDLLQRLGIDVGQLASIYFFFFAVYRLGQYLYVWVYDTLLSHFTSHVEVDDWDLFHKHLLDWASAQRMTTLSRELRAVTFDPSSASGANTIRDRDDELMLDGNGLFNFQRWYSRTPLVYKPNFTSKYFMHNGHLFYWLSGRRPSTCGTGFDQYIVIRCFGRSTKPIKDLLHDIKGFTLTKSAKTTDVYHSTVKGDGAQWHRQSVRPSRPIATVALGEQQKAEIILDINEYLQPATARWYASRGIPYRRGSLLHGPPGTGKTSLSVALAGIFGLSIYCVSLCETGLTESHLATLFDQLPERCVVLLEDVDTAGLRRDSDQSSETLAVAPATMNGKLVMSKSLISLGGLLNVIDGAASQEGRVLIMTTNCITKLDNALVRPGRIDHQIHFALATHEQIREIFERMYDADSSTENRSETSHAEIYKKLIKCDNVAFDLGAYMPLATVQHRKINELAELFAKTFSEGVFSPAEIQGYLLKWKADPEGALCGAKAWNDTQLEAKRAVVT